MGWFTRNPGVTAERRVDELDAEIAEITALEERLTQASEEPNDPGQLQLLLDESANLPVDPILRADEELSGNLTDDPERDCPGLYNDQGLRKFDLYGLWERLKQRESLPITTPDEKVVTYLVAGRNVGYLALRKEQRVARNRFIILTLALIALLWTVLSLLVPQL